MIKLKYPKAQKLYETGYPWTNKLHESLDDQIYRRENNKASCIVIDGSVGSGKTTTAEHIADYCERRIINPEEYIGVGGERFQQKLSFAIANDRHTVVYDEAGDLDRRGAITKFNTNMVKIFQKYRAFKIIVIVVLPLATVLETRLFWMGIPRFLIHVKREIGRSSIDYSVYDGQKLMKLVSLMQKIDLPQRAYTIVRPNYRGHIYNLDPVREKKLAELGLADKRSDLDKAVLEGRQLKTAIEVSKILGCAKSSVFRKLKEKDIKPSMIYNNVNYYDNTVINQLRA